MKKFLLPSVAGLLFLFPFLVYANSNLSDRLSGRILLQVEEKGEAWYIEPTTKERAFLGRPDDAFRVMRELGLGISEKDFKAFGQYVPKRLSGRIILRVEAKGEAYYVNPVDLKMHFLGRPADAFGVMRQMGLGVTNQDIEKVPVFQKYAERDSNDNLKSNKNIQEGDNKMKEPDAEINEKIKIINNSIISLKKNIDASNNAVKSIKNDIDMLPSYYLVQSSGQQLINEIETVKFLTNKSIDLLYRLEGELRNLLGAGKTTTNYIKDLESQIESNTTQLEISSNKIKNLYEVNVQEMNKASADALNKATEELDKVTKAVEAVTILNKHIKEIDDKLPGLFSKLEDKRDEIEQIKKKPILSSMIYNLLNKAYDEHNVMVIEYNDLLDLRDELVRLFGVLDDYVKKDISIPRKDLTIFNSFGIKL